MCHLKMNIYFHFIFFPSGLVSIVSENAAKQDNFTAMTQHFESLIATSFTDLFQTKQQLTRTVLRLHLVAPGLALVKLYNYIIMNKKFTR